MLFKDNYFFLSNFYICDIELNIEGKVCKFSNVEAAYQAQKVPEIADKFSQVKGLEAKRLGEKLKILKENWEVYHLYAMANALNSKFKNRVLFAQLNSIIGDIKNENYWGDTYWGIYKGEGKNILGKMLGFIRDSRNDLDQLYKYIEEVLLPDIQNLDLKGI